jgi:hypothetical protein
MAIFKQITRVIAADGNTDITLPPRLNGFGSGDVVISGTITIQLQGSNDGTNYANIGSANSSTTRNIAMFNGAVVYRFIRMVASSTSSGTATVTLNLR